ncbi:MAG: HAD domain-containing protein [Candidatus Thorarchaeota archaeon]|jgi:hypothetical protein
MKIIFLDFDGVICTAESYADARTQHGLTSNGFPPSLHLFDTEICGRVQEICDATGAVIVLSTTWRELHKQDEIVGFLRHHGITAHVVDQTPILCPNQGSYHRGKEIKLWMDAHPEVSYDDIVVLEDDVDAIREVPKVHARLVQTYFMGGGEGFEAGLQPHHVKQAIELLNTNNK